jgi:hypothetical protein
MSVWLLNAIGRNAESYRRNKKKLDAILASPAKENSDDD